MADPLTRALRGLRRDGARAKREPGLLIAIGLADKGEAEESAEHEAAEMPEEETSEGTSEEMSEGECPLCGGEHDASIHAEEDE